MICCLADSDSITPPDLNFLPAMPPPPPPAHTTPRHRARPRTTVDFEA